ncbi:MAG: sulfite exporter TauE/SafE family protein [Verrucomicrobia bacterium]|nr:sulfite exporter TauE/SafE family protein [Verrucomicrobiota bacterium]MCH8514028.1 sulfite exporter TauE/SafE family protein [Kiritimatiellia bacterium]
MVTAYLTAFVLGLGGSLHCLGMCGPLALALPAGREASRLRRAMARLVYNLGRTVTYAIMGLFAGSLGHILHLGGVQRWVSIVLGVLLISTLLFSSEHMPRWVFNTFYRPVQRGLGKLLKREGMGGFFQIGLLNGLLPCGLVYAALAMASVQQGPLQGAGFMALFGLGTVPMMFAISMGGLTLRSPRFQPVLQYLLPALTLIAGIFLILRGLSLGIPYLSPDFAAGACCPTDF